MALGDTATEACVAVVQRIVDAGPLEPHETVAMIALAADGTWGSASIRPGYRTSIKSLTQDDARTAHRVLLDS